MTPGSIKLIFLAMVGISAVLGGCTTTASGPVEITKVNPYHLLPGPIVKTDDRMIEFEHRRHLRGAVETTELRERYGNHYTVFWKSETRNPATVRLEYRQGKTGLRVHTQEVFVASPKRTNTTHFKVVGGDYQEQGKVTQWKASILENGTVVAEYQSYLWQ